MSAKSTDPFQRDVIFAEPLVRSDQITSAPLQQLFDYWNGLRDGDIWPLRSAIDPERFSHLLSYVILARWDEARRDFYFRITGSVVDRVHGISGSQKFFSDIWQDPTLRVVQEEYTLALTGPQPYLHQIRKQDADKEDASFERILLPISFSGDCVDGLFGGLENFTPYWPDRLYNARKP